MSGGDAVFASLRRPVVAGAHRDRGWYADRQDADSAAARPAALTSLENTHDAVVRLLGAFDEQDMSKRRDVVWVSAEPINRAGGDPPSAVHGAAERPEACCAAACSPTRR